MNKTAIILIAVIFLSACSTPRYIPRPADIEQHVKGFIFKGKLIDGNEVLGEIIEVKQNKMKILMISVGEIKTVLQDDIEKGELMIASKVNDPEKVFRLSLLSNLLVLGHGYFGVFTLPLNILNSSSIHGYTAVRYGKNGIYWNELYKFARFPQGIPEGINENEIR